MQRLKDIFKGYWQPKAGTIYPALERLSEASLITCRVEHREDAPDRRYYTITKKGEEVLKETVRLLIGQYEELERNFREELEKFLTE